MDSILGMLIFCGGGLAGATFLLPARGVKGWAYETGWLVSVLAGWLVFPLVFDAIAVPDFWNVLGVFLGEWKGTSWRTRTLLSAGIVILAFGFAVMAVGGK